MLSLHVKIPYYTAIVDIDACAYETVMVYPDPVCIMIFSILSNVLEDCTH